MTKSRCAALAGAALTALMLSAGTAIEASPKRTDVVRKELSIPGHEVIQVRVDFGPSQSFPWHSHPGSEVAYVLEGTVVYEVEGQTAVTLKRGEALYIPPGQLHTARNGSGSQSASELATYIVPAGEPLVKLRDR